MRFDVYNRLYMVKVSKIGEECAHASRLLMAVLLVGHLQGRLLGLEIDVSTSGSVYDTSGRFEQGIRHFWS